MKRLFCGLIAVMLMFVLVSCGSQTTQIDKNALASHILQNVSFAEHLEEIDSEYAVSSFDLDPESCSAVCFNSSAAVADTLTIFEANDESYVSAINEAVNAKIDYLKEGYSDYGPAEVPKIENAVVITEGRFVVFCICPDSGAAEKVIQNFIK